MCLVCSLPGSSVLGILQAITQEWVAISFSKAWKWKVKVKSLSGVGLFRTLWTATYQAPPSPYSLRIRENSFPFCISNQGEMACFLWKAGVGGQFYLWDKLSSMLAWKIPWTEEPDRLQSMGSQRVRHNWTTSLSFTFGHYRTLHFGILTQNFKLSA